MELHQNIEAHRPTLSTIPINQTLPNNLKFLQMEFMEFLQQTTTTFVTIHPTIFDTVTYPLQLELSLDGLRNIDLESNYLDGVSAMNTFGHLLLVVPVVI